MRALVWLGGDRLEVQEVPEPVPAEGEVLFEVELAGICGSDLHPYRGRPDIRVPPFVLGHEAVGYRAGQPARYPYVIFPLLTCGVCPACRQGEDNACERRGLLGLDRPGVFSERLTVPETCLVPLPRDLDARAAALVEPLATAVSTLRSARAVEGSHVLVVGCGPIGLVTVYACVQRGVRVVAVEPVAERRGLAQSFGASLALASIDELGAGYVDAAIDAVGVEATWRAAIAAVRRGGQVVVVGLGQTEGAVPMSDLVRRGITMHGHYAYRREDFRVAMDLLATRPPPLDWVSVIPLESGPQAFRRLVTEPGHAVKALLAGPTYMRGAAVSS